MFSRNVKPGMFWLGIAPKATFLAYSTQFVILIIRPENVVMVAINMCGKSPITGSGYMELSETMCILIFQFILL